MQRCTGISWFMWSFTDKGQRQIDMSIDRVWVVCGLPAWGSHHFAADQLTLYLALTRYRCNLLAFACFRTATISIFCCWAGEKLEVATFCELPSSPMFREPGADFWKLMSVWFITAWLGYLSFSSWVTMSLNSPARSLYSSLWLLCLFFLERIRNRFDCPTKNQHYVKSSCLWQGVMSLKHFNPSVSACSLAVGSYVFFERFLMRV